MSGRLTPTWTRHVRDAYGETGEKGFNGESWLADMLRKKGYNVTLHEHDKTLQIKGIDLTVEGINLARPITVDVKANIKLDGTFFIEINPLGWLFNPKKVSDLIWHVNPSTGQTIRYSRKLMKDRLTHLRIKTDLLPLNIKTVADLYDFVKITNNAILK